MILPACSTTILPLLFKLVYSLAFPSIQIQSESDFSIIRKIPTPAGFYRIAYPSHSFASWLENIPLKKNDTVFLYNGRPKSNQTAQYAVLAIPIGNKDLQQCADAVMRLRAMWLHEEGRDTKIHFENNVGKSYRFTLPYSELKFDSYLQTVFSNCGTLSLEKQLKTKPIMKLEIGDVFIRGGSPGHAMIVVDKAVNENGQVVYMLAQSYMPAQDIHIVRNPARSDFGPWFPLEDAEPVFTPEWIFAYNQLRTW